MPSIRSAVQRRRVRDWPRASNIKSVNQIPCASTCSFRRGISLVEMLVVMTIAAVMVGLSATTMHRLLRAEHEATMGARFSTSVARLGRAFRDDLHAARDVELPLPEPEKSAALVAVIEGGRQVRYELDSHLAIRIETEGAEETQRETYHFPPRTQLHIERAGDRGLVRITINMRTDSPGSVPPHDKSSAESKRRLVIEAAPVRARWSQRSVTEHGGRKDDELDRQQTGAAKQEQIDGA